MKILIKGKGSITLSKSNYKGSGGEGTVYCKDGIGYKIYHDPKRMIPVGKIQELNKLKLVNVLAPQDILLDGNNNPVGFTMPYVDNVEFLCKLFTKSYRDRNGISPQVISDLVKEMQKILEEIHKRERSSGKAGFLVVDYNEMNFLVTRDFRICYNIDVDSYQTPSFPATALMESVRDRRAPKGKFSEETDWFSWAVVTFQLYMGVHPYKGRHDNYKPKDWMRMMDDGVSVFHKDVRLPAVCQDWAVIPKPHLEWYKAVFLNNDRSKPPYADQIGFIAVAKPTIIPSTDRFEVTEYKDYGEEIHLFKIINGMPCAIAGNSVYIGNNEWNRVYDEADFLEVDGATPIVASKGPGCVLFFSGSESLANIKAEGMMSSNGLIYTIHNGILTENSCTCFGNKKVHHTKNVCNIFEPAYKIFPGVVIQDIIGTCWMAIPYKPGACANLHIKELDGYRIIDAKYQGENGNGFCVIMAEKKSEYTRFVLCFKTNNIENYTIRKDENTETDSVNFTVLSKGLCVMVVADLRVEAFFDNNKIKVIERPPFDSSMKMFNDGSKALFASREKLYSITLK